MGLEIPKVSDAHQLSMEGAYGVDGIITASHISIVLEPLPDKASGKIAAT
ncbi:hypothetical protein ABAC460_16795 [Asticcacaulis sp. AC460]|nr:hypothetical protein ABAC460_16795 [Asticcacaulis sp. AC460]